jgi:hypothetical protein
VASYSEEKKTAAEKGRAVGPLQAGYLVYYIAVSVLLVAFAIRRAYKASTRGKAQRQFDTAVKAIARALRKVGARVETLESSFDIAYKRWATYVWRVQDVYVRLSMEFPALSYEVAPAAEGPWIELSGLLRDRAGELLPEARNDLTYVFACTGAHVRHWWLVRSFLIDPGLDDRLRQLVAES